MGEAWRLAAMAHSGDRITHQCAGDVRPDRTRTRANLKMGQVDAEHAPGVVWRLVVSVWGTPEERGGESGQVSRRRTVSLPAPLASCTGRRSTASMSPLRKAPILTLGTDIVVGWREEDEERGEMEMPERNGGGGSGYQESVHCVVMSVAAGAKCPAGDQVSGFDVRSWWAIVLCPVNKQVVSPVGK